MVIGYARVSTQDHNPDFQVDALEKVGCDQIFQEKVTGKLRERPELLSFSEDDCTGSLGTGQKVHRTFDLCLSVVVCTTHTLSHFNE